ncbi:MAG TPA: NAD(P)H-binding protein [Alicyclobacillus sp.]|nr:NAD(P)H-binding protein [Alicyclobacillus sp.]
MNIIVFGASGGTGREFVGQALEDGHDLTAFVRDVSRLNITHPHLRVVQGNALDREAVFYAIAGHDAVVRALEPSKVAGPVLFSRRWPGISLPG